MVFVQILAWSSAHHQPVTSVFALAFTVKTVFFTGLEVLGGLVPPALDARGIEVVRESDHLLNGHVSRGTHGAVAEAPCVDVDVGQQFLEIIHG